MPQVKLQYMDGRSFYRWVDEELIKILVPREGHEALCDEWREFRYTFRWDPRHRSVYEQIP